MTELKRLEAITKSPAVGIFSDTLHGLTATRAFRGEAKAEGALLGALDRNARSWFWWLLSQRYLGFYLDAICVTFLACLLVATILLRNHHQPQILALALLYAVQLAGTFQWTVRQHALAESFMASVAVWKSNLRRLTPSTRHCPRSAQPNLLVDFHTGPSSDWWSTETCRASPTRLARGHPRPVLLCWITWDADTETTCLGCYVTCRRR